MSLTMSEVGFEAAKLHEKKDLQINYEEKI